MLKGKTPLLIAVVLGLLAGAAAYTAIKSKEREVKAGWVPIPVLVASKDLPEGTALSWELVSQRPIPEQFVTTSVVRPESASYVIGQKILVPVQAGDPLLWSQFETSRATERLSSLVLQKGRALTLEVSGARMSVGGWVRPNDHVDVLGSFRDPASGESISVTLMQNVVVIATGRITGTTNINLVPESDRQYSTITFLVLPEEAEILSLAAELGALTLTLRNPEDLDQASERGHTSINTLLTGVRSRILGDVRGRAFMTLVKGNQVTREPIP